jgi:hypothetical protein
MGDRSYVSRHEGGAAPKLYYISGRLRGMVGTTPRASAMLPARLSAALHGRVCSAVPTHMQTPPLILLTPALPPQEQGLDPRKARTFAPQGAAYYRRALLQAHSPPSASAAPGSSVAPPAPQPLSSGQLAQLAFNLSGVAAEEPLPHARTVQLLADSVVQLLAAELSRMPPVQLIVAEAMLPAPAPWSLRPVPAGSDSCDEDTEGGEEEAWADAGGSAERPQGGAGLGGVPGSGGELQGKPPSLAAVLKAVAAYARCRAAVETAAPPSRPAAPTATASAAVAQQADAAWATLSDAAAVVLHRWLPWGRPEPAVAAAARARWGPMSADAVAMPLREITHLHAVLLCMVSTCCTWLTDVPRESAWWARAAELLLRSAAAADEASMRSMTASHGLFRVQAC